MDAGCAFELLASLYFGLHQTALHYILGAAIVSITVYQNSKVGVLLFMRVRRFLVPAIPLSFCSQDTNAMDSTTQSELFVRLGADGSLAVPTAFTWGVVAARRGVLVDLSQIVIDFAGLEDTELRGPGAKLALLARVTNSVLVHAPRGGLWSCPLPLFGTATIEYSFSAEHTPAFRALIDEGTCPNIPLDGASLSLSLLGRCNLEFGSSEPQISRVCQADQLRATVKWTGGEQDSLPVPCSKKSRCERKKNRLLGSASS